MAVTGAPAGQASVKLVGVKLAAAIGLLKVTNTLALVATPVVMGVLVAGEVAVTVGVDPIPGVPRIGSRLPPPQAAMEATSNANVSLIGDLGERWK
jgi:hypothetical protein